MTAIDADGKVLGRLASRVAEHLKDGEDVTVVNAEGAVVSGKREDVYARYRRKRKRGSRDHGPNFPKAPDRILKRTVRGMLPKNAEGREAFKRLKVFRGNPQGLEVDEVGVKSAEELTQRDAVSVGDISKNIG